MLSGERVVARCRELAAVTDVAGQTHRTFLSPAMQRCNALVGDWMRASGAAVVVDAAGNLRGRREGSGPGTLVIASHLDTVPNAGAFDGPMGVIVGIEVLERLQGKALPFAIEVIGFSEEEGVRYGVPFIGSRAAIGTLGEDLLARRDAAGVSIAEALAPYAGVSPRFTDARAYLEVHIEQGPVLEAEELPLGIVETIVGQSRLLFTFTGSANHAGTTPMELRRDAVAAAAEWVTHVEATARAVNTLVATVGRFEVTPNAGNVIGGQVLASLDVRHPSDMVRKQVVAALIEKAQVAAASRRVTVAVESKLDQQAAPMDKRLTSILERAVRSVGVTPLRMPSGAGHDAMVIAPVVPSTMLFVRTPAGLSHHPDETVISDDVELAVRSTLAFVEALAEEKLHA